MVDASGFYQDGAHNKGKTSDTYLRARRWTALYKPQKDSDANPAISERMKAARALIKAADDNQRRRFYVAPHCTRTAEAFRNYENTKHGTPNRRSVWAHIIDGSSYVAYRLFGRPKVSRAPAKYERVGQFELRDQDW